MISSQKPGVMKSEPIASNPARPVPGFLGQLARGPVGRKLPRLGRSGRELPEQPPGGMPVLPHEDELLGCGRRQNHDRAGMLDDVEPVLRTVRIANAVDPHVEDAAFEDAGGIDGLRHLFHAAKSWRNRRTSPRTSGAVPRSSVLAEIGWLAYFIAIFVGCVYAMVIFVVPHHFNDKIAIVFAGIVAGLAMILTRAWWRKRTTGSPR